MISLTATATAAAASAATITKCRPCSGPAAAPIACGIAAPQCHEQRRPPLESLGFVTTTLLILRANTLIVLFPDGQQFRFRVDLHGVLFAVLLVGRRILVRIITSVAIQ